MKILKKLVSLFIINDFIGVDRNSVEYFELLMKKVRNKNTYINKLYNYYYSIFINSLNKFQIDSSGLYLELGSGYGFFQNYAAKQQINIIRTDVVRHKNIDQIVNAENIPFSNESISAIFMFGVLHHIKNTYNFFNEAKRVLKKNGAIIMIEPTANKFAEIMYKLSHSEPFNKNSSNWIIPGDDPMTCANLALPELIFKRDIKIFNELYPNLKVISNSYHSPLLFQMSGGGPYKPPLGENSYYLFRVIDFLLTPLRRQLGMFSTIIIIKE